MLDLVGQKFGELTVIAKAKSKVNKKGLKISYQTCQCSCGNIKDIKTSSLRNGATQSCGCKGAIGKVGSDNYSYSHGMAGSRLYQIWNAMKTRCYNINDKGYKNYGGRGIKVCDEWKNDFSSFYQWSIKNGYDFNAKRSECTLDRINVNENYCPNNCRWISMTEQNRNKTQNNYITYNGETKILKEWAKELHVPCQKLTYEKRKRGSWEAVINYYKEQNYISDEDYKERNNNNYFWITNGIINKQWTREKGDLPQSFYRGRTISKYK